MSFELIAEAREQGGLSPTVIGATGGALAFTGANVLLAPGGLHRRVPSGRRGGSADRPTGGIRTGQ
ncbi:hypothetical protein ABZ436_07050 [Micromonospora matsumotoense]|uniref:hypothetical protein n=1 Tax=Micromonospora matsumotoense TaxID=121616 RepID=UPI0033F630E7